MPASHTRRASHGLALLERLDADDAVDQSSSNAVSGPDLHGSSYCYADAARPFGLSVRWTSVVDDRSRLARRGSETQK